jgi:hypothetical protein
MTMSIPTPYVIVTRPIVSAAASVAASVAVASAAIPAAATAAATEASTRTMVHRGNVIIRCAFVLHFQPLAADLKPIH